MSRKDLVRKLLKGIETGDPESATVVSEERYIQHNPHTQEGGEGLASLFKRLAKTNPKVNIVRIFQDEDFVFAHTEYDFSKRRIGFEIFRFEGNYAVEHWDNIQSRKGPNPSGHSMVDGPTESIDFALTDSNRELVCNFVTNILIGRKLEKLGTYMTEEQGFIQHSPELKDGISCLRSALALCHDNEDKTPVLRYDRLHHVLAEGNFVLTVCEGSHDNVHTSFYDLFRVERGKIVEHWDTIDGVAPRSEWKNNNGKFGGMQLEQKNRA